MKMKLKNIGTRFPLVIGLFTLIAACNHTQKQDDNTMNDTVAETKTTLDPQTVSPDIDSITHATAPAFELEEFGMFDDDDPIIYFVASVNEAKAYDHQYIYADGPDSVAIIKADGKRQLLKTLESDVFENGDDDYRVTSFSQNEDYEVRVLQKLTKQEEAHAYWTGHITVTRRADGAVFKSAIWATSSH